MDLGSGLEIARAFVREGARVHVCDVDAAALEAIGTSDPATGSSVCDVTDRPAVADLFDQVLHRLGGLDCLINHAAISGPTGPVHEIRPEDWDPCLEVCIIEQFNCTRLAVELLKGYANASIVDLSSGAGKVRFPNRSPHAATKWAVVGFTKTLAMELGPYGIRCNAILPGGVEGERIRRVVEAKARLADRPQEQVLQAWLARASIKELVAPTQLADMILPLALLRSRTVSGQAIRVDADLRGLL